MSRTWKTIAITCLTVGVAFSSTLAQDTGSGKKPDQGAVGKGTVGKDRGKVEKSAARGAIQRVGFKDSTGKEHMLSQYKDKILVLEWTNKGCPYVVRHYKAGTMKTLAEKFAKQGVVWLAIDSNHYSTANDVEGWRKKHELPYPVLMDPEGALGRTLGAKTTPHMYIVRNGEILYSGAIDDNPRASKTEVVNFVEKALQEIVAGKTVSTPRTDPYGCSVKYAKAKSTDE